MKLITSIRHKRTIDLISKLIDLNVIVYEIIHYDYLLTKIENTITKHHHGNTHMLIKSLWCTIEILSITGIYWCNFTFTCAFIIYGWNKVRSNLVYFFLIWQRLLETNVLNIIIQTDTYILVCSRPFPGGNKRT